MSTKHPGLVTEQVKLGPTKLEFRDQLLVFLDKALATRRDEPRLVALVGLQLRQYAFSTRVTGAEADI